MNPIVRPDLRPIRRRKGLFVCASRIGISLGDLLKHHQAVPQGRVAVGTSPGVEEESILIGSSGKEILDRSVGRRPVGVVHHNNTACSEIGLRNLKTSQLIGVIVVPVVQIETDGSLVHLREILLIIHVEEVVIGGS